MSTQTIKDRPLVTPINTGRTLSWLSQSWKAVLAKKKQLMLGGAGVAVLGAGCFLFLGKPNQRYPIHDGEGGARQPA